MPVTRINKRRARAHHKHDLLRILVRELKAGEQRHVLLKHTHALICHVLNTNPIGSTTITMPSLLLLLLLHCSARIPNGWL